MRWIYIVQDDGKDGAYLASFSDEKQADEYADYIGPANVHKVPYFGDTASPVLRSREGTCTSTK